MRELHPKTSAWAIGPNTTSILSTSSNQDYTLLEFGESSIISIAFLGWSSDEVADNTSMFRISHPQGQPQAYSKHSADAGGPKCHTFQGTTTSTVTTCMEGLKAAAAAVPL